ncbi:hypothetical protein RHMOL_Rhmol11G0151200 [Rhododendron molle]|uniref:Uncharacterized protein n=1 Tax=Rhododendron molle TaxID=49168 RepID=A0ACC0LSE1_RHOML|nr:hypothetical protein RHMOL_Rhmol11G0151200 [Rhododendron molle]
MIHLDAPKDSWSINKIVGLDHRGDDEEVISKVYYYTGTLPKVKLLGANKVRLTWYSTRMSRPFKNPTSARSRLIRTFSFPFLFYKSVRYFQSRSLVAFLHSPNVHVGWYWYPICNQVLDMQRQNC